MQFAIHVPASKMTATTAIQEAIDDGRACVLRFSHDVERHAGFTLALPSHWGGRRLAFRPVWSPVAGSGAVAWALQAVRVNTAQLDIPRALESRSFGFEGIARDVASGVGERIGSESTPFEIPSEGDGVTLFRVWRKIQPVEELEGDVHLMGVELTPAVA